MHTNCPLSWYFILLIISPTFALYVAITEFDGSVLAFSIDITFIHDWIEAALVSISATARYLLSFEIVVPTEIVEDKYVLNNSFPSGLNVTITVL